MSVIYRWIHRVWYEDAPSGLILLPLSGLYWLMLNLKELLYRHQILSARRAEVPVIVVGNITTGGTGKTPTVIWLVNELRDKGYTPGIVSRGYGRRKSNNPIKVNKNSNVSVVGDEPILLAKRGGCPVAVDTNRARAVSVLIDDGVDVIVADDGLQHLQLERDFEICVIDGSRGLGNLRLIPSGPLREMPRRLRSVDQILINGEGSFRDSISFKLLASDANRLNGTLTQPLQAFRGKTVHAIAGIGNPARFFELLRSYDIQIIEHNFPDHAELTYEEINFDDQFEVLMTEKDAVKFSKKLPDKFWFIPVDLNMNSTMSSDLIKRIEMRLKSYREKQ